MICPRCSIGDISHIGSQCTVCGFVAGANVALEEQPVDEVLEVVRKALGSRFDIQALLRMGERSFVYLARELGRDRLVAFKVIPVPGGVDGTLAQRFAQQADLVMRMTHAHAVPLYDYGSSRSFVWYTMPHLPDATLAETLRRSGAMDAEPCAMIVQQIAGALDHAHRQGVVHANLKPPNIFVTRDNWARVSDFALVDLFRRAGAAQTVPARPEYMAPEQFHGRGLGPSVDQYALGVIAFESMTGTLPFVADSFEEIARLHVSEPPPLATSHRDGVPPRMAEAIRRAMGKTPGERFPTILDFATALAQGAAARISAPQRAPSGAGTTPTQVLLIDAPAPRRLARWFLAAALVLGAAAFWLWNPWGNLPGRRATRPALTISPSDLVSRDDIERDQVRPVREPPPPAARRTPTSPVPSFVTSPAGAAQPAPPPTAFGRVFVNSTPWGELYIDGSLIGNTPKADLVVPAGKHVIRVVRDGFLPFEQTVQLANAQILRLTEIVLAPRPQ